jgi:acyl-lipid omega-6 desaturase (Delta-12 desaturase)
MHSATVSIEVFGRKEYIKIKAALRFERNYGVTLLVIILDWLLVAAAILLLRHGGAPAFVGSQCLLAVVFFHNFAILHEAGHGNTSSSRVLNTITGLYASVLCFMPFFPWKYIHQKHHVWAGNPEQDPTGRNVKRWQRDHRVPWVLRAAWRSWIPLGALAQHFVFWSYPAVLLREDKSKLWPCVASVLLLPSAYLTLYFLWPQLFCPANFVPAFIIYLFAEELVNLPHHSDLFKFSGRLPLWEQWKAARSCYYPVFVSELLVLNFNFHIEHHLYPSLPWYRLRSARSLVRRALEDEYNEAVGIGWNLSNRSRDIQTLLISRDAHRTT